MSKHTKANPKGTGAATPALPKPGARDVVFIVSAAVIGLVGGIALWKINHPAPKSAAPLAQVNSTSPPADAGDHASEFQKLKGKWVRPDGGYVIEVRSVEQSGRVDASYS